MPQENAQLAAQTFLSGACLSGQASLCVRLSGNWPTDQSGQFRVLIDNEILGLQGGTGPSYTILNRGLEGTFQIPHNDWAAVQHVLTPQGVINFTGGVNTQTGSSYTFSNIDRASVVVLNNAGAVAVTLPKANSGDSATYSPHWYCGVYNAGAGVVTITPTTSTINGGATFLLRPRQFAVIYSDGTNYSAYGLANDAASTYSGNIASGQIAAAHVSSGTIVPGAGIAVTANATSISISNLSGAASRVSINVVGNEPGSPNSGDLFLPSNGFSLEAYNGSLWAPQGPLFPFTAPSDPGTWLNQGSATITSYTNQGYFIRCPNDGAQNLRGRYKVVPATSKASYMAFLPAFATGTNQAYVGFFYYDSFSGKCLQFCVSNPSSTMTVQFRRWTNSTTFSVTPQSQVWLARSCPVIFFKAQWDGTNFTFWKSDDGQNWMSGYSEAASAFMLSGASHCGFCVTPNAAECGITVLSYLEQ